MLAITNGKIYTITQGILERGTILVEGGKITALGHAVPTPAGATVIDAAGNYVFPGFIEAHGHAGVMEDGFGWEGRDGNELTDPVTAHVRAIDAINPEEQGLRDAVEGGITTLWSTPGSGNVIGGDGVTIKAHGRGRTVDEMVIKYPSGLKAAMGENPKRVYGNQKKMPSTRMGVAGIMREALTKGQNYLQKLNKAAADPDKPFERDLRMESIARVLKREIPLRVHAHRADDIMTAIRIAEEFDIEITIEHCTEGHKVA
ncbi:MAG: amidohydrolase, partial [Firmicutes bacterium]|nr:amidohydrolase [Bacillota bacterium]